MNFRDIKIVYEDNHLLVVEKPYNVLSQGDITGDIDLHTLMKEYIKVEYKKPGNVYLGLVHRLDRPVGGVMVFAKTSKCASRLSEQIRERRFEKGYLVAIEGVPEKLSGKLSHYLLKDRRTNMTRAVREGRKGAKLSTLKYEVFGHAAGLSLVKVQLITGRAHQIRVQFSTEGHPIYGDHRYGDDRQSRHQIALWAYKLGFTHPTKREPMEFCVRPPKGHPWNVFSEQLKVLT